MKQRARNCTKEKGEGARKRTLLTKNMYEAWGSLLA